MNVKDAVIQTVPVLHATPIYWAAAMLATGARFAELGLDVDGPELVEALQDEDEMLLDTECGKAAHALQHAAAMIWRSVDTERRYAVAQDLLAQLDEVED